MTRAQYATQLRDKGREMRALAQRRAAIADGLITLADQLWDGSNPQPHEHLEHDARKRIDILLDAALGSLDE